MMASFMLYCKKINPFTRWLGIFLTLFSLTVSAGTNVFQIKNAELIPVEETYLLNADMEIKFNSDIEQAINKGFVLSFLIEFQLVSPRKYWFDDEITTVSHTVTLSYHALSKQYLIIQGEQQQNFATLDEAIQNLATIRDLKVLKKNLVEKAGVYNAILLVRLDPTKLAKTLQVEAVNSNDWSIKSQRFEWAPNLFK